jgi:hypothetical protein
MVLEKLVEVGTAIIAEKVATTIFLQLIKPFTAEQVNQAICEDINLWDHFDKKEQYLRTGMRFRSQILANIDRLSPETILNYMREKGEPWYEQVQAIRNTPGGVEWFATQVNFIKAEIKSYYYEQPAV